MGDQARGGHAAKLALALDDQNGEAFPPGRQGGRTSGRAAAADDHVVAPLDGNGAFEAKLARRGVGFVRRGGLRSKKEAPEWQPVRVA